MTNKKLYNSKTPNWQRVSIWIIAVVMTVGTLLTFFVMVFAGQNPDADPTTIAQKKQQEVYDKYMQSDEYKKYLEQQKKAANERLQKLRILDGYTDKVTAFNAEDVTSLKTETLKEGNGATVKKGDTIRANYTGWKPDGSIFDSTKLDGEDATPVTFSLSKVIEGWGIGLVGAQAGGVYLLSIPASQAYGEAGNGDAIPANTPLRFIVEIVEITSSTD